MNGDGPSVAQIGAFETVVADQDMTYVRVLKYYSGFSDWDTCATIGAFFSVHDIGAVIATGDGPLGADLHTLAALNADLWLEYPRLREKGLDFQAGFFGIDVMMVADGADLHAQAASATLARGHFDSL